jgi:hypothetical protein
MGYKFTKCDKTVAPGPGTYHVRTKLKSQKDENYSPKKKGKRRKRKRKAKSRAATTRSDKYSSSGMQFSERGTIDFRKTAFSTFIF